MKEFKGTQKVYAVEYAGFIRINDEPYYEGNDVLDFEQVGEEAARANAKIQEAAPELLKALEIIMSNSNDHAVIRIASKAINKAL